MEQGNEVTLATLAVRMPVDLRRAVKRYAVDRDMTVAAVVNEVLKATMAEGNNNSAARLRG